MFGMRMQKVGGSNVIIKRGKESGTIRISKFGWFFKTYNIVDLKWTESGKHSMGKAAAWGLGAGILTGGLGLLLGALFGGRRRDTSIAELLLSTSKGRTQKLLLRCNARQYSKINDML